MIVAWGVDYSMGLNLSILKKYQAKFACRYIGYSSFSQEKILTKAEADLLRSNGIDIVSNWEWDGLTPKLGFNEGVYEAKIAAQKHLDCGGPPDRPIYFSADFNAQGPEIADYYKGVASVIGLARTGAYTGYTGTKYLLDNGLIKWAWQTYAWSGQELDTRANIYQYLNGVNLGGMTLDYDNALTQDYGQWGIGGKNMNPDMRKAFETEWRAIQPTASLTSGIANMAWSDYQNGNFHGPALTLEYQDVDWNGNAIVAQDTPMGTYHWRLDLSHGTYYPYK